MTTHVLKLWGFIKANKVERVHLHFLKKLLGVNKQYTKCFVYGECNRKSLFIVKRQYCIIKYWFKILQCNERKYVSHIYKMMLADLEVYPNKVNWAYLVQGLLYRLGFYHVRLNQGVVNVNAFLNQFKQRLNDNFTQNWYERLRNSSRAIF